MLEEVADFRRTIFGGSLELNLTYLTWKYFQNPYLRDPVLHIARNNGEVVGMRGWFGTSWELPGGDAAVVIPHAAESAILPHHRRQGLFRELTLFALDDLRQRGFPLVMSMSATEYNYVVATEAMGWRSTGNYQMLVWRRDAGGEENPSVLGKRPAERLRAAVKSKRGVARLARIAKRTSDHLRGSRNADPFGNLEDHLGHPCAALRMERAPLASLMAEIASSSDDRSRIIHTRDETYFVWRYRDPRWTYRFFYPTGDSSGGFCVLASAPSRPMTIVDWSGDGRAVTDVVELLVAADVTSRIDIWGRGLPQEMRKRLLGAGFHPEPNEKRGMILRTTRAEDQQWSTDAQSLLDIDDWNLRMIFSDRY